MKLTKRDDEILDALATRVRALSVDQLVRGWWPGVANPATQARRRLKVLAEAGYVQETLVHVSPGLPLAGPLMTWVDGDSTPDFGALAYQLQTRWSPAPPKPIKVVLSTVFANSLFGGPASRTRFTSHHATHDLHLSEIYLIFREIRPEEAASWLGEDVREKSGFRLKDPDAIIDRGPEARPLVVEFGGRSYDANHLRTIHDDCAARGRDYELW
jgi:hypothetical protein